jgi:peptide-methionine (S)-S-oxide reductase
MKEVTTMKNYQKATFGAGCFWGVEYFFKQVPGVIETEVGYLGGAFENPTYEQVKTGNTGHAEVVQLTYDPTIVSYEELLNVFWNNHNPTTRNRQGEDVGTQYRSAIFYHTNEQKVSAELSKEQLKQLGQFNKPIVTEITAASSFYRAEEYHQNYIEKNDLPSCHIS